MKIGGFGTTMRQCRRTCNGNLQPDTAPTKSGYKNEKSEPFDFFFDGKVIMKREFVPPGDTVNQKFYFKILEHLR
jgi:hypothetical protein